MVYWNERELLFAVNVYGMTVRPEDTPMKLEAAWTGSMTGSGLVRWEPGDEHYVVGNDFYWRWLGSPEDAGIPNITQYIYYKTEVKNPIGEVLAATGGSFYVQTTHVETAIIEGTVVDKETQGAIVSGVARGEGPDGWSVDILNGYYESGLIVEGTYNVTASASGYDSATKTVAAVAMQTVACNFELIKSGVPPTWDVLGIVTAINAIIQWLIVFWTKIGEAITNAILAALRTLFGEDGLKAMIQFFKLINDLLSGKAIDQFYTDHPEFKEEQ